MGNRGSIQITNGNETSVVLFKHWGGDEIGMINLCKAAFIKMSEGYRYGTEGYPHEVIALLTQIATHEINSSAYLGATENDGDNGSNGHFILEIGPAHKSTLEWKLTHYGRKIWWKKDGVTRINQ